MHASASTRNSIAASMNIELHSVSTIALRRAKVEIPARRIQIDISQNVAIQSGTCAQRMAIMATAPGE